MTESSMSPLTCGTSMRTTEFARVVQCGCRERRHPDSSGRSHSGVRIHLVIVALGAPFSRLGCSLGLRLGCPFHSRFGCSLHSWLGRSLRAWLGRLLRLTPL